MFIPRPRTHSIKFGSAGFSDLAMAEKVLPPPSEQSRPWPCAGPRAAERESWQSLEAHLPEDPSICVDVTSKTAAHFDFADVLYYSLKVWLHWTEDGHPHTLYIQHHRLHQADHGSQPHSQWGPLKPSRVDFRFKQLRMTLTDGTIVPVYGETGTYLIHETGATIHASNKKQAARLSHHISFHEEADLKKEYFDFSLDKTLLQQGEGYVGRTMPPQTQSTAQPSSEPAGSSGPQLFRNDHRNDTTVVQVHLRQLRMISSLLKKLETLSARFEPSYDWSRRYTHLRGMVDSVTLAHQVRVLVSPVGEDLGRLS